jgi:hypothetical protein
VRALSGRVAALGGHGIQTRPAMGALAVARRRPDWAAQADAAAATLEPRR